MLSPAQERNRAALARILDRSVADSPALVHTVLSLDDVERMWWLLDT